MVPDVDADEPETGDAAKIARRHIRVGLWSLAAFVVLGAALETFHAYKSPFYLDAGHETTRLLLRLAHAHGTLLSLVQIVYGVVVNARPAVASRIASGALLASLVLIPIGFLLGGTAAHGSDPGLPIALVPPGALALVVGLVIAARRS
jgi:hypothetical protein